MRRAAGLAAGASRCFTGMTTSNYAGADFFSPRRRGQGYSDGVLSDMIFERSFAPAAVRPSSSAFTRPAKRGAVHDDFSRATSVPLCARHNLYKAPTRFYNEKPAWCHGLSSKNGLQRNHFTP